LGLLASASAVLLPACNQQNSSRIRLAFITNNAFDFWQIARRGAEEAGKQYDVDVEVQMPAGGKSQRALVEDMTVLGVRGIALSPNSPKSNMDFFRDTGKKVLLVTQDNDFTDPTARRCYVGTNNYKAGRAAGKLVKQAVPDGGKIVIFVGRLDATNAVERQRGVLDELADAPEKQPEDGATAAPPGAYGKYQLLQTKTDGEKKSQCRSDAADILLENPDVAAVVGLWAYNPPALLNAVEDVKKQKPDLKTKIIGFDESEETLQGIRDGAIVGTIVQDPYQFGFQSIRILAGLARGNEGVLKETSKDSAGRDILPPDGEGRMFVEHRVITKDNVEKFSEQLNKLKGK
jgi:ribose transport system substrate-binding protein